mmetsp:Transcript_44654/g.136200  ORF Transcript_44654/g.136200 Transcript_44654/m.136200 type:complete len:232 (-) Transcript_44654:521-1216(-)
MSASYLAAPRITEEEEQAEQASMTEEEKFAALRDLYGVMLPAALGDRWDSRFAHQSDEEEPIEKGLEELEAELNQLIRKSESEENGNRCGLGHLNTACVQEAKRKLPQVINSTEHRLKFLRAESFDVKKAAVMLIKYWEERITIFGEDKAFLPLNLSGALRDDEVGLSMGFITLSPERDSSGRAVLIVDQSKLERKNYTRNMMVRLFVIIDTDSLLLLHHELIHRVSFSFG